MQIRNNTIPRGLVPLEELFDSNDVAQNPDVTPNEDEDEYCNIEMKQELKVIKLSKSWYPKNRENYIILMK